MTTPISDLGNNPAAETSPQKPRNRLDQDQFFNLMLTQLKNQDPLKPLESAQFFGQLAQFSTVAGISDLQTSFSRFASSMQSNQTLQAAGLVGRAVLARGDIGLLPAGAGMSGTVELPADAGTLRLRIYDARGQLVRHLDLGAQTAGTRSFTWDGVRDDGQAAAPGTYSVRAEAVIDGKSQALATSLWTLVDSVTLDVAGTEPMLNLLGLGPVPFSKINQIR